jgi:hypothetical protein
MILGSIVKPCYDRKIFWIHDRLVAFEFGEHRIGSDTGEVTIVLIATYVLHNTDATGNPTGTSSYNFHRVASWEEGQRLLEAASETGATEWLLAYQKKWDNYSQTSEILNWLRQRCIRQFLHWRWVIRWRKQSGNVPFH